MKLKRTGKILSSKSVCLLKASSSVANIDEWKWKLSLLSRNEQDQEIVSRDKKDRRDYEQISYLANRMGLYRCSIIMSLYFFNMLIICQHSVRTSILYICYIFSETYGKVMVVSKVPLPNYRPDLDDKRPQREVLTSRRFKKTF